MNIYTFFHTRFWSFLPAFMIAFILLIYSKNFSLISYVFENNRINNIMGIFVILAICVCLSKDRKAIDIKLISYGLLMHLSLAVFVLKTSYGQIIFSSIAQAYFHFCYQEQLQF